MAKLIPDLPDTYSHPKEYQAALELSRNLPEEWTLIANISWSRASLKYKKNNGEIDYLVLTTTGVIHVIEYTEARAELDIDGDVVVVMPNGKKNKTLQLKSNKEFVIEILKKSKFNNENQKFLIESWLLVPNLTVTNPVPLYQESQIVDSTNQDAILELANRIKKTALCDSLPINLNPLIKLFLNELDFTVDPSSFGESSTRYIKNLEPLSSVILDFECPQKIIVIDGVAGSGKTQLALIGMQKSILENTKCALVSNTKVLPSLMKKEMGDNFPAYTTFNFPYEEKYEIIYVEEAHHLNEQAINKLIESVTNSGRIYLLMDSKQNFDDRFNYPENSIIFHLDQTYRVPSQICSYLNSISLFKRTINPIHTMNGQSIDIKILNKNQLILAEKCAEEFINFIRNNQNKAKSSALIFCGNQFELEKITSQSAIFKEVSELCTSLDSLDNKDKPCIDTIRRFQGSSRGHIYCCGFDEGLNNESSAKLFYSAVTRCRSNCTVYLTENFAKKLIDVSN